MLVRPGKNRRAESNPFSDLGKLNDKTELRKQRRAIESDEFARLVNTTTSSGRLFRGLDGLDRAVLYTLAAYTGLRASEIGSLKTNSFDFGWSPTVTVKAAYTKNDELAIIPLKHDLADRIQQYIDLPRDTLALNRDAKTIWPGTWSDHGAEMIKKHLKSADIPYTDDEGSVGSMGRAANMQQIISSDLRLQTLIEKWESLQEGTKLAIIDLVQNSRSHFSVQPKKNLA